MNEGGFLVNQATFDSLAEGRDAVKFLGYPVEVNPGVPPIGVWTKEGTPSELLLRFVSFLEQHEHLK